MNNRQSRAYNELILKEEKARGIWLNTHGPRFADSLKKNQFALAASTPDGYPYLDIPHPGFVGVSGATPHPLSLSISSNLDKYIDGKHQIAINAQAHPKLSASFRSANNLSSTNNNFGATAEQVFGANGINGTTQEISSSSSSSLSNAGSNSLGLSGFRGSKTTSYLRTGIIPSDDSNPSERLGITVDNYSHYIRNRDIDGVIVTKITRHSHADDAGIRTNDLIYSINNRPTRTVEEFNQALLSAVYPPFHLASHPSTEVISKKPILIKAERSGGMKVSFHLRK